MLELKEDKFESEITLSGSLVIEYNKKILREIFQKEVK